MRPCRHCSHQNADHLAYCSRCGRRLPPGAFPSGPIGAFTVSAALGQTVVAQRPRATPAGAPTAGDLASGPTVAAPPGRRSRLRWVPDSIGYIYVYLRGKADAGERRRRLSSERDGAQALLSGAVRDLGSSIVRDGIEHPDITDLREAVTRAQDERDHAVSDLAASE